MRKSSRNLTTIERDQLVQFLLQHSINGKPARGKITEAAIKFGCGRKTVSRLWAAAKEKQEKGEVIYLQSGKVTAVKRKRIIIDFEMISQLELVKRSTIRRLVAGINQSKSTVGRWVTNGLIKAHTNAIKPDLTTHNKLLRVQFSLSAIHFDTLLNTFKFRSMHNIVHIDEKWFYITRSSHKFYMTPNEVEPHRTCKSKKFITKVMFMCAVCRPIIAADGTVLFDGKIGIFPLTEQVPAKRSSKNRPAGTLETKPIESITKQVIKDCLINQILPAIKSRWPQCASKHILIQQDNARPHIADTDPDFRAAASSNGFNIKLVQQPPNSPDLNVNDLGWFRAIQSIQTETQCFTVDQLVNTVMQSFEQLSPTTLNNVFLSLQSCMVELLKVRGQNCYRIPHMKKGALIRQDALPIELEVPEDLVRQCIYYLLEAGIVEGIEGLMEQLRIAQQSNMQGIEELTNQLTITED